MAISAIPPALSVTGPYASKAITIPAKASIDVTEIAIPNKPANLKDTIIPKQIIIAGTAVASKLTASPWIIFVACPVSDDLAILCTGLKLVPV